MKICRFHLEDLTLCTKRIEKGFEILYLLKFNIFKISFVSLTLGYRILKCEVLN
jgi:hypothetical protein